MGEVVCKDDARWYNAEGITERDEDRGELQNGLAPMGSHHIHRRVLPHTGNLSHAKKKILIFFFINSKTIFSCFTTATFLY